MGSSTEADTTLKYHLYHCMFISTCLIFKKCSQVTYLTFFLKMFKYIIDRYQAECLFCTWLTLIWMRKFEWQFLLLSFPPSFPIFSLPVFCSFLSPSGFILSFPVEEKNRTDIHNLYQSTSSKEAGSKEYWKLLTA